MSDAIPTILLESNTLFRESLRRILESVGFDIAWCSYEPPPDIIPAIAKARAPLILIGGDYEQAIVHLTSLKSLYPHGKGVLLADQIRPEQFTLPLLRSVSAVVLTRSSCDDFIASLGLIAEGAAIFPAGLLAFALTDLTPAIFSTATALLAPLRVPPLELSSLEMPTELRPSLTFHFSAREQGVLKLLSRGLPNKEIARVLQISDATVKVHVKAILRKSRARNRTEIATWASRQQMFGSNENSADFDRSLDQDTVLAAPTLEARGRAHRS